MTERGAIRNREHAQQLRDFRGLRYGKITPTDIDAFMDFGGKVFVFIEAKHGDAALPYGQRLALERLVDACARGGVATLLLVAQHDTAGDVDYANCPVRELRVNGVWRAPKCAVTVRAAVDYFRMLGARTCK